LPRHFLSAPNPDFRKAEAFEFVDVALQQDRAEVGASNAGIPRSVIVARGADAGLSENDLEVAVAVGLVTEHLIELNGTIALGPHGLNAVEGP
jgi:hypothetical protein